MLGRLCLITSVAAVQAVAWTVAPAQVRDGQVRVSLWYAQQLAAASVPPRRVVFVLPDSTPENPIADSLLRRLAPAFRQAGLAIVPHAQQRGRDTLLVVLSAPMMDSVSSAGTFYTLLSDQSYCGQEDGTTGFHASHLRCTLRECYRLYETVTGAGLLCRRRP